MTPRPKHQWHAEEDDAKRPVSRSQRKRDSLALQETGEELTLCSDSMLAALPISDELRQAVKDWRRIPSREGKRRQVQFIGRLMREAEDAEAIAEALRALRSA